MENIEEIEFANIDGTPLDFVATNATQDVGANLNEFSEDAEFFNAEGDDDEFYNAEGDDDDFYNLGGGGRRERRADKHSAKMAKKEVKTGIKQSRASKIEAKGGAKLTRAEAKLGASEAQKIGAKSAEKIAESDLAALSATSKEGGKKPMSMGLKIGIGVGVALVLGLVTFLVIKKMNSSKK